MSTIFYGLPGEGLGHACRTQAILEHLDPDIRVHVFTWGEAYDFFAKQGYQHLHRIAGIPFGRGKNNSINLLKTVRNFLKYWCDSPQSVQYVLEQAKVHKPDVFVSDFEGIIPQAARKYGKPLLSIDNQHKFSRCISNDLPWGLWFYAGVMGWYAEWTCPRPDYAVVSTFYHSDVKKRHCDKTVLTNCFMRKAIEERQPTTGDYLLMYYKTSVGTRMLEELARLGEKVVVYNCPPNRRHVREFEYREVDNDGFIDALAGCRALFCSAGNQLLGEAVYYGKPLFAVPEPNQPEQRINAHYVATKGYGTTCAINEFTSEKARDFLSNFKLRRADNINGVYSAIEQIKKQIEVSKCQS